MSTSLYSGLSPSPPAIDGIGLAADVEHLALEQQPVEAEVTVGIENPDVGVRLLPEND